MEYFRVENTVLRYSEYCLDAGVKIVNEKLEGRILLGCVLRWTPAPTMSAISCP